MGYFLRSLASRFETGVGKTGIVALLEGSGPGRTIGIRADMDALPIHEETGLPFASKVAGKMHACGHDVHTVIALGVAAALSEMKDSLKGRIKFIFQPAEETLSGAPAMIADGVLDEAPKMDAIIGYHNWPPVKAGTVGYHPEAVMASADAFDLTLKGRTGHGAHPHLAIDALAAGAYFVAQVQTVVSREVAPLSPAVLSIGEFHSGTARNVIAPTAILKGSVRTMDPAVSKAIEAAVRRMLEGMKTGMRVDYELDWKKVAPALRQHPATLASVLESHQRVSRQRQRHGDAAAQHGQRGLRVVRREGAGGAPAHRLEDRRPRHRDPPRELRLQRAGDPDRRAGRRARRAGSALRRPYDASPIAASRLQDLRRA